MKKNKKIGDKIEGLYKREPGLDKLSAAQRRELEKYCSDYMKFLGEAKTERLAYDKSIQMLEKAGFKPLSECVKLKAGDKIYRGYHGKTLLAAVIGKEEIEHGINVVGGHTDAPRLDLKPVPLAEMGGLAYFDTHYYGGIKKFQWVTHPLALYGVVCRQDGSMIDIAIGDNAGDPVFMITDILPHLGQEQSQKKLSEAIPGESLDVLIGSEPYSEKTADASCSEKVKYNILRLLKEKYSITEEDLTCAELEIVPAGMPRELGLDRSLMTGYGHDDRICAFAGLRALLDIKEVPQRTAVIIMCDKEEIGSCGASGMDSNFFPNTVAEIIWRIKAENYCEMTTRRALEASRMISADVTAASDPHFQELDSPLNMPFLNAGVTINKYTGSGGKARASDARAEFLAEIRATLEKHGVVWQIGELGKVDKGGGGTIALYMARYGMDVIDIGTPLLNMHAPWEIASKFDTFMTYRAYCAFFAQ